MQKQNISRSIFHENLNTISVKRLEWISLLNTFNTIYKYNFICLSGICFDSCVTLEWNSILHWNLNSIAVNDFLCLMLITLPKNTILSVCNIRTKFSEVWLKLHINPSVFCWDLNSIFVNNLYILNKFLC